MKSKSPDFHKAVFAIVALLAVIIVLGMLGCEEESPNNMIAETAPLEDESFRIIVDPLYPNQYCLEQEGTRTCIDVPDQCPDNWDRIILPDGSKDCIFNPCYVKEGMDLSECFKKMKEDGTLK